MPRKVKSMAMGRMPRINEGNLREGQEIGIIQYIRQKVFLIVLGALHHYLRSTLRMRLRERPKKFN